MGIKKDKECINILMGISIMDIGWLIKRMEKEIIFIIVLEISMKEIGVIIKRLDKENIGIKMGICIRGILVME